MSWILIVVTSLTPWNAKDFKVVEFHSQDACLVALKEAKKFYRTVNNESKCISVEKEIQLKRLQQEINGMEK